MLIGTTTSAPLLTSALSMLTVGVAVIVTVAFFTPSAVKLYMPAAGFFTNGPIVSVIFVSSSGKPYSLRLPSADAVGSVRFIISGLLPRGELITVDAPSE